MARPHPDRPLDLDALLREEAWLRRLARSLVGDAATADDVTQDVVTAALDQRPALSGAPLRAWLRTTARRTASRWRRREAARGERERRVARPEHEVDDARERLAVHRRLHAAIEALGDDERTVLVLRYLDERSTAEVAARLGVSEVAARKRVSRALARLRTRLDGEFGDRRAWMGAVGVLAFGDGRTSPAPGAPVTTAAAGGVVSLLAMKKLLALTALAAVALVLYVRGSDGARRTSVPPVEEQRAGVAAATPVRAEPVAQAADAERSAREPVHAPDAAPRVARLRVVDVDGEPIADARAAWIDPTHVARPLVLDERASVALPSEDPGARFLAAAPDLASAAVSLGDAALDERGDLVLVLEPLVTLRGRLLVDGGPPPEPVPLSCFSRGRYLGLAENWDVRSAQERRLEGLGLLPPRLFTTTRPDGTFEVHGVRAEDEGYCVFPSSYRLAASREEPLAGWRTPSDSLVVRLTRIPHLFGRVEWSDGSGPASGSMIAVPKRTGEGTGVGATLPVWPDGRFEVGLLPEEGGPGELGYSRVDVGFAHLEDEALDPDRTFDLSGRTSPIDVGVVRLTRAPERTVTVVDSQARPIEGATVLVDTWTSSRTDAAGRATLLADEAERLWVVASGYAVARRTIPSLASDATIVLEAAARLRVEVEDVVPSPDLSVLPRVRLVFQGDPFDHGLDEREEQSNWSMRALRGIVPGTSPYLRLGDDGSTSLDLPILGEAFDVPGLVPGTAFDALLLDSFGNELARERAVLPTSAGTVDVLLRPEHGCSLTFEVVDDAGRPIERAHLLIRTSEHRSRGQAVTDGRLTIAPVAPGPWSLRASARGHLDTPYRGEVVEGDHLARIELLRAREVALRFEDEHGAPVTPDWAVVRLRGSRWCTPRLEPEDGRATADTVPFGELDVLARLGTRSVERPLGAGDEHLVVLPAAGTVRVRFDELPTIRTDWGDLAIRVTELDVATVTAAVTEPWSRGTGDVGEELLSLSWSEGAVGPLETIATLLPGRYSIHVALQDGEDAPLVELYAGEFEVSAGRETLVEPR